MLRTAGAAGMGGGATRHVHVAVVGSGPAGFYTSKFLMKQGAAASLQVDMFERLPTPFGLVRFGVAPDHPEVKNVINDFATIAETPGFRFFGNVQIGADVPLSLLEESYDAVVLCTGAQGERKLGIRGEELRGVVGAPEYVKWYNGHPDHVSLDVPNPGETAVVLGQGNVALDVARILARSQSDLAVTDITPPSLARIAEWQQKGLKTVQVVGRRGFVQAAFTNAELRELLTCSDELLPVIDPAELELCRNEASLKELEKSRMKKRSLDILAKMAENFAHKDTTSKRVLWLRFLLSPSEFLPSTGDSSRLGAIRFQRQELQGAPGAQRAASVEPPQIEDVPCGLVVRSIGFDITPMDGLPLNERNRVPHKQGRVEDDSRSLYVSGWVKRGPQGIIASNIADAQETATRVVSDLSAKPRAAAGPAAVEGALAASGKRIVSFDDWLRLEEEEKRRGAEQGRSAVKITDVSQMLQVLA